MSKIVVSTDRSPQAIGPYNQGVIHNNIIYVSGQLPIDINGNIVDDYIYNQTIQCLKNIENILIAGGSKRENILKLTVFLTNLDDFKLVNEAFSYFFQGCEFPARTTVQVSKLPKNCAIEIDAIAFI